jgi:hypothetical protein
MPLCSMVRWHANVSSDGIVLVVVLPPTVVVEVVVGRRRVTGQGGRADQLRLELRDRVLAESVAHRPRGGRVSEHDAR